MPIISSDVVKAICEHLKNISCLKFGPELNFFNKKYSPYRFEDGCDFS
jgi:hypothetical protein